MTTDRVLVKVDYITWVPAEHRLASNGQIDINAKMKQSVLLWAPVGINPRGEVDPSLLKPEEQGLLWAQREVIRMRPKGHEVLGIDDAGMLGVFESQIINQSVAVLAAKADADTGLRAVGTDEGNSSIILSSR